MRTYDERQLKEGAGSHGLRLGLHYLILVMVVLLVGGCGESLGRVTPSTQTATSTQAQAVSSPQPATTAQGGTRSTEVSFTHGIPPAETGWYEHTRFNLPEWAYGNLVVFPDSLHGWVIGADPGAGPMQMDPSAASPLILATKDGGEHWTRQDAGEGVFLPTQASFPDSEHGWILDISDALWSTEDGGGRWSRQNLRETLNWGDVHFLDAKRGWLVGTEVQDESIIRPLILATVDGGATWTEQRAEDGLLPLEVRFTDPSHGWIVAETGDYETLGIDREPSVIISTSDGGATWSRQLTTDVYVTSLSFADSLHGWAVGFGGVIFSTLDGGQHWSRQEFTPDEPAADSETAGGSESPYDFYAVSFSDLLHGWAVSQTRIVGTSDGGAHWATEYSQPPLPLGLDDSRAPFSAVSCPDRKHVWAIVNDILLARAPPIDGGGE